jgi:hypothetical protein
MHIGLLYEGLLDENSLKILVGRIVAGSSIFSRNQITFTVQSSSGPIIPKMEIAAKIFFDGEKRADFAVFMSDIDGQLERKKNITDWVKEYSDRTGNIIVVGIAEPKYEHWLMKEGNAIKNLLSIPGDKSIYDLSGDPKWQMANIYDEYNKDSSFTLKNLYTEASEKIEIEYLKTRDKSFESFLHELSTTVSKICE